MTGVLLVFADNDKRYMECFMKHSNVTGKLNFHKLPADPARRAAWICQVLCSNHFIDGKPTKENPDPTLLLTATMNCQVTPQKIVRSPPRKRLNLSTDIQKDDVQDFMAVFFIPEITGQTSVDELVMPAPKSFFTFQNVTEYVS